MTPPLPAPPIPPLRPSNTNTQATAATTRGGRCELELTLDECRMYEQYHGGSYFFSVGDSATLGSDGYLGWLLEHAQEQEAYDSAWSWLA